jgi:hypothetical protein
VPPDDLRAGRREGGGETGRSTGVFAPPKDRHYDPGVLTRELADRIAAGMSLLIATVDPDGSPHAGRAWGVRVLDLSGRFREMVDADDARTIANLTDGRRAALTVSEVNTHLTFQFKGRPLRLVPATAGDQAAAAEWGDRFLDAINQFDGYSRAHLEHWRVTDCLAFEFEADEMFDQAPGPGAGRRVDVA